MIEAEHAPLDLFGRAYASRKRPGGQRTRSAAATWAAYAPLLPRFGITRVAEITGLDVVGIPVFSAIRPSSRTLSTSQGKGLTRAAARVGAMMESIESWHAEHVVAPLTWDTEVGLRRRGAVVDLDALPLARGATLDRDQPRVWIEGYDLLAERRCWLPFDLVDAVYVGRPRPTCFAMSSIGLASGNHLLEAVLHGLCEVIERDAEELWYQREHSIRVALDEIDEAAAPRCAGILAKLAAAEVHCMAFDISSDIDLPCYHVRMFEAPDASSWRRVGAFLGSACALEPRHALARALCEGVQSRLTQIAGSRDDILRESYTKVVNTALLDAVWAEYCDASEPRVALQRRPSRATESLQGDIRVVLDALRAVGMTSAIVVDLTRIEFGIPVVKVVIPGLEAGSDVAEPGPRARTIAEESRT